MAEELDNQELENTSPDTGIIGPTGEPINREGFPATTSDVTPSGTFSLHEDIEGFTDYIPDGLLPNNEKDLRTQRARNQSGAAQGFNAIVGGVASGVLTAIDDVGYIADIDNNIKRLQDIEEIDTNSFSKAMVEGKKAIDEALPIYRTNPGEVVDFSDSGFYWSAMKGLVDSAVGFGLVGMGAGALVKGVGMATRLATRATRMEAFVAGLTSDAKAAQVLNSIPAAYLTNFGESKMMALETFDQILEDLAPKVKSGELTEKQARTIAGDKADTFMLTNKMFMVTDAIGLAGIFKGKGITRNLIDAPTTKNFLKSQLKNAPLESVEEIGQNILQSEQIFQAHKVAGIKDDAPEDLVERMIEFGTSEQALLEGAMGFLGGPLQYGITQAPFNDSKGKQSTFDEQQTQLEKNQEFLNDKLQNFAGRQKVKTQAAMAGDETVNEELAKSVFITLASQNFMKGTTAQLERSLEEVANDPASSKEDSQVAREHLETLADMEKEWIKNTKYQNQGQVFGNRQSRKIADRLHKATQEKKSDLERELLINGNRLAKKHNIPSVNYQELETVPTQPDHDKRTQEEFEADYQKFINEITKTEEYSELNGTGTRHSVDETLEGFADMLDEFDAAYNRMTSSEVQVDILRQKEEAAKLGDLADNITRETNIGKLEDLAKDPKNARIINNINKRITELKTEQNKPKQEKNETSKQKEKKTKGSQKNPNVDYDLDLDLAQTPAQVNKIRNNASEAGKLSEELNEKINSKLSSIEKGEQTSAEIVEEANLSDEERTELLQHAKANPLKNTAEEDHVKIMAEAMANGMSMEDAHLLAVTIDSSVNKPVEKPSQEAIDALGDFFDDSPTVKSDTRIARGEAFIKVVDLLSDELGKDVSFEELMAAIEDRWGTDKFKKNFIPLQSTYSLFQNTEHVNTTYIEYKGLSKSEADSLSSDEFKAMVEIGSDIVTASTLEELEASLEQMGASISQNDPTIEKSTTEEGQVVYSYDRTKKGDNKIAFLSREFMQTVDTQDENGVDVFYVEREDVDNKLNQNSTNQILDPTKYQPGTKLTLSVDKEFDGMVYDNESLEKEKIEWVARLEQLEADAAEQGVPVEQLPEYVAEVPVRIKDEAGNTIGFLHNPSWINEQNVDNKPEELEKQTATLTKAREDIIAQNEVTTTITEKGLGHVFRTKSNENVSAATAVPKGAGVLTVMIKGSLRTTRNNKFKGTVANEAFLKSGASYKVFQIGEKENEEGEREPIYFAVPLTNTKVTPEIATSIRKAIEAWINPDENQEILDDVKRISGYDLSVLTGRMGLSEYIRMYLRPFSVDGKNTDNAFESLLQGGSLENSGTHLLAITGNNIMMGRPSVKMGEDQYRLSISDKTRADKLEAILDKIESGLPNMFLQTNADFLEVGALNMPIIAADGSVSDINNGRSYEEFILDTSVTSTMSHNIGTEEDPNYIVTIQPRVEIDMAKFEKKEAEEVSTEKITGNLEKNGFVNYIDNSSHGQDSVLIKNGWALLADGVSSNKNSKAFADALLEEISKDPVLDQEIINGIIEDLSKKFKDAASTLSLIKKNPDGSFSYYQLGDSPIYVVDANGKTINTIGESSSAATDGAVAGHGVSNKNKINIGKITLKKGEYIISASDGVGDVLSVYKKEDYSDVLEVSKDLVNQIIDNNVKDLTLSELADQLKLKKGKASVSLLASVSRDLTLLAKLINVNPSLVYEAFAETKEDDFSIIVLTKDAELTELEAPATEEDSDYEDMGDFGMPNLNDAEDNLPPTVVDTSKVEESQDSILIPGLSPKAQYDLISTLGRELFQKAINTQEQTAKEVLDDWRLKFETALPAMRRNLEKAKAKGDGNAVAAFQAWIDRSEAILNNYSKVAGFTRLFLDRLAGIKTTDVKADGDLESDLSTEDIQEFDKTNFEDNFSLTLDSKNTASARLKRFLAFTQDVDKNGAPRKNLFNMPRIMGFDEVYNTLHSILVDVPADTDLMVTRLEEEIAARSKHFWLQDVVDNLNVAPTEIRNEFAVDMNKHYIQMRFVLWQQNQDGTFALKKVDANSTAIAKQLIQEWSGNLKASPVIKSDADGEYRYDISAVDNLIGRASSWIGAAASSSPKLLANDFLKASDAKKVQVGTKTQSSQPTSEIDKRLQFKKGEVRKLIIDGKRYDATNRGGVTVNDLTDKEAFAKQEGYNSYESFAKDNQAFVDGEAYSTVTITPFVPTTNKLATLEELGEWLGDLGMDLTDQTLSNLLAGRFRHKKELFSYAGLFQGGGLINEIVKELEQIKLDPTTSLSTKNIMDLSILSSLANEESRNTISVFSNSHRAGKKTIYSYSNNKYLTEGTHELQTNKQLRDFLGTTPFTKDSLWLKELNNPDSKFSKEFKHTYVSLEALKEQFTSSKDNRELNNLTAAEHEVYKVGLFTASASKGGQEKGRSQRIIDMLYPTMSDKSTMMAITSIGHDVQIKDDGSIDTETMDILYDALVKPEIERIKNIASAPNEIKGYKEAGENFLFLSALNTTEVIIGETTMTIGEAVRGGYEYSEEVTSAIKGVIREYVDQLVADKMEEWAGFGIGLTFDGQSMSFINNDYVKNFSKGEDKVKFTATDFVVNYLIGNSEVYKLYIGDPALFSKFKGKNTLEQNLEDTFANIGKRLAGDIAPGVNLAGAANNEYNQIFLEDPEFASISQKYYNSLKLKAPKEYAKIEGADAQEYTTWQEHVYVLRQLGRLSDEDHSAINAALSAGRRLDGDLLGKVLQPLKPVYVQNVKHPLSALEQRVYIKSSSFPLIPQLTSGLEIDKLRTAMEKLEERDGKTVRAAYGTATKVGFTNEPVNIFNKDKTMLSSDDIFNQFEDIKNVRTLPRTGFKIQLDIPFDASKAEVGVGTQERKLLFMNMLQVSGFDYKGKEYTGQDLQQIYFNKYEKIFKTQKEALLSRLVDRETGQVNPTQLSQLLKSEAISKGFPLSDIEWLEVNEDGEFDIPVWLSPSSDKFEALLTSIISNKVVKTKMPGNSYILASEEGFQSDIKLLEGNEGQKYIEQEQGIVFTDSYEGKLMPIRKAEDEHGRFILDKNGKHIILPAQVIVPFKFRNEEGELLSVEDFLIPGTRKLDTKRIPKSLLKLFGFRIPTQGPKSMADIEIVGFTPFESGDMLIGPRDWTKQMGSDFDVDKLYTYSLNHNYDNVTKTLTKTEFKDTNITSISSTTLAEQAGDSVKLSEVLQTMGVSRAAIAIWEDFQDKIDVLKQEKQDKKSITRAILTGTRADLVMLKKSLEEEVTLELADKMFLSIFGQTMNPNSPGEALETINNKLAEIKKELISVKEQLELDKETSEITDAITEEITALFEERSEVLSKISDYIPSLKNDIIDIHFSVMSNPALEVQSQIAEPLAFGDLKGENYKHSNKAFESRINNAGGLASAIAAKRNEKADSKLFTILSDSYQRGKYTNATAGKAGVGVFYVDSAFNVIAQGQDLELKSSPIMFGKDNVSENEDRIENKREITVNKLSRTRTLKGDKYISDVIEAYQSASVDNEKEQILDKVNINNNTFGVIKILNQLGFDEDTVTTFISQDIVVDYIEELKKLRSSLVAYSPNSEQEAFDNTIEKYEKKKRISKPDISTFGEEHVDFADFKNLTGDEAVEAMFNMLGNEDAAEYHNTQIAIIFKFIDLAEKGKDLGVVQSTVNIDSKGVGKNIAEMLLKKQQVDNLSNNSTILNAGNILGKYKEDAAGEITFDAATTINGQAAQYGLNTGIQLWSKYFPHNTASLFGASSVTKEINDFTGGREMSTKSKADFMKGIMQEVKSFLFTKADLGLIENETVSESRERLFIDTKNNDSLATILSSLSNNKVVRNNTFLNKLRTERESNGTPSKIMFQSATGENFDESSLYTAFADLIVSQNQDSLGEFNGIEYTPRMLAQELMAYAFLEGGVQQAIQFIKYVPTSYLKSIPFAQKLKEINLNDESVLGLVAPGAFEVSAFSKQWAQHNGQKLINVAEHHANLPEGKSVAGAEEFSLTDSGFKAIAQPTMTPDGTVMLPPKFVSFKNGAATTGVNKWLVFEYSNGSYKRISTLGGFGFKEYNFQSVSPKSMVVAQNAKVDKVKESVEPVKPTPTKEEQNIPNPNPISTDEILNLRNGGNKEDLVNVLSSIREKVVNPYYAELSDMLIKNVDQISDSFKIKVDNNIGGKGSYEYISGKLVVNPSKHDSAEELAETILHETLHAFTSRIVKEHTRWKAEKGSTFLTKEQLVLIKNLETLKGTLLKEIYKDEEWTKEFVRFAENYKSWTTDKSKSPNFTKGDLSRNYAATKLEEFITMALTDKDFQNIINGISASGDSSFLDKIVEFINDVLRSVGLDIEPGSVLEQSVVNIFKLVEVSKSPEVSVEEKINALIKSTPAITFSKKAIDDLLKNNYLSIDEAVDFEQLARDKGIFKEVAKPEPISNVGKRPIETDKTFFNNSDEAANRDLDEQYNITPDNGFGDLVKPNDADTTDSLPIHDRRELDAAISKRKLERLTEPFMEAFERIQDQEEAMAEYIAQNAIVGAGREIESGILFEGDFIPVANLEA